MACLRRSSYQQAVVNRQQDVSYYRADERHGIFVRLQGSRYAEVAELDDPAFQHDVPEMRGLYRYIG